MRAYLGVDAGGSHTRAVLVSAEGEMLGAGRAGPANFRTGPMLRASAAVSSAVRRALAEAAGSSPSEIDVDAAFLGSAGLEGPGDDELGLELLGGAASPRRLRLDSDVLAAWAGSFAGAPGIVLSAGTGSICLGVTAAGERIRVGGWGPKFGDEGSAYAIARHGIKAALAAADGRGPATALLPAFLRFIGAGPASDEDVLEAYGAAMTGWLYAPGRNQADIARFAPAVEEVALQDDKAALSVLERAGRELAAMVATVVRRWGGDDVPVRVATNGGVLRRDGLVRERFLVALEGDRLPVVVESPRFSPEVGAALLAMELGGVERPSWVLVRLDEAVARRERDGSGEGETIRRH